MNKKIKNKKVKDKKAGEKVDDVRKKVYSKILDIAKSISRKKKEGALFIIANKNNFKDSYRTLYPIVTKKFSVFTKGVEPIIEKLATLDGAVLITNDGFLIAYGAMIKYSRPMPGFGTKHAAASGFTRKFKDSTAVLVDENIDWIKIFQNGKIILELDSEERPSSIKKKIIDFVADHDMTLLTTAGVSAALFGITPVLVLSGTYMFIKTATGIIRKSLKRL